MRRPAHSLAFTLRGVASSRLVSLPAMPGTRRMRRSTLCYVHDCVTATGVYDELDLIADPDDPRDLFGMLMRAAIPVPADATWGAGRKLRLTGTTAMTRNDRATAPS